MTEDRIADFLRGVENAQYSALLLDYDGTLAPFSVDRDRALPFAGIVEVLQDIAQSGRTRLVVITGRDARQVGPLLGLTPSPEIWGSHGLQRLRPNGACEMPKIPITVTIALDSAWRWLAYQGLQDLAEIKAGSIAIHWRALDENAACELRSRVLLGWTHLSNGNPLKLLEFDGGVEMRISDVDKGNAVLSILGELGPEVPVAYLGDDATDESAFQVLGDRGLTVLVRPRFRRTAAQAWLKPPEGLLDFFSRWAKATAADVRAQCAAPSR